MAMSDYTHAGAVAYRLVDGRPRYLVVTASDNRAHWVLPKGHIEPGERPAETALRELKEETGVDGSIEDEVGRLDLRFGGKLVRALFFLVAAESAGEPEGDRELRWCRHREATALLTFPESRRLIDDAHAMLDRRPA